MWEIFQFVLYGHNKLIYKIKLFPISGFTDQLNLLAEAFHKYEIDEVSFITIFEQSCKQQFLDQRLPTVCCLRIKRHRHAQEERTPCQDCLPRHEVSAKISKTRI